MTTPTDNNQTKNKSNHLLAWVACVHSTICNLATVLSASLTPRKVAQRVSSNVIISYQERQNRGKKQLRVFIQVFILI